MRPMIAIMIPIMTMALGMTLAGPAQARSSLGIFEKWGAFRDDTPLRCFAITEPERQIDHARWRAFASVAHWPGQNLRGQVHIRLSRAAQAEKPVTLRIGSARFVLSTGGGADAWAANPAMDAAIVQAMRSARLMRVDARDPGGRPFTDVYHLPGVATAIDAAALGCARQG